MRRKIFFNYRCKRCGGIVSQQGYDPIHCPASMVHGSNKVFHLNCPNKIDQEEDVVFELISTSSEPLDGAVDVIYLKGENNE